MPNIDPQSSILFGGAVKALGKGKVGGYLVLFGSESEKDLAGEYFTKNTDYDVDDWPAKASVYYHHGLDPTIKARRLSKGEMTVDEDELGIWIEAQLDLRDKYEKAIYKMADAGKLGWSSGTASHLIEIDDSGEIKRWPLGPDASLTPTPCDPRNLAATKSLRLPLKAVQGLPSLEEISGLKSEGIGSVDKNRMLQDALDGWFKARERETGQYGWGYVEDVFDSSFVFRTSGKYFEVPFSIENNVAVLGSEPVEVQLLRQFVPLDGNKSKPTGMKAVDEGKAVLGAAKAYFDRVAEIRKVRAANDQDVSRDTLSQLKALHDEMGAFLNAPDPEVRRKFEEEVALALRFRG